MGKHISRLDLGAYGYVGAAIENLDHAKLLEMLDYYQADPELNKVVRGKSLLDLAIDNIDKSKSSEQLEEAFRIIETLVQSDNIDKHIVSSEGESFLSHLIDKLEEFKGVKAIEEHLQNGIRKVILESADPANYIKNLQTKGFKKYAKEIEALHAVHTGNIDALKLMVEKDPKLLQETFTNGTHLLKVAALNDQYEMQNFLIDQNVRVDNFDLSIDGKRENYLGNLIHDQEEGAPLISKLIKNGKIASLLNEDHIKTIYQLGFKTKPALKSFKDLFNQLLETGLLNDDMELELEPAGYFSSNLTVKDLELNNIKQFLASIEKGDIDLVQTYLDKKQTLPISDEINVIGEIADLAIDKDRPQLISMLINNYNLSLDQLEEIVGNLLKYEIDDNALEFSKAAINEIVDPAKKLNFIEAHVKELAQHENFTGLLRFRNAQIIDQELIDKQLLATNILFKLYDVGEMSLLSEKLDKVNKSELILEDESGYNIFHHACFNGQTELASKIFAKKGDPFQPQNDTGLTPIMMLALSKKKENAVKIFNEFAQDKNFLKEFRDQKDKFVFVMLALKNDNVALANAFMAAHEPKPKEYGQMLNELKKAKDGFRNVRNEIMTNIFYRAINSDDTKLVQNFFAMYNSQEFNPSYLTLKIEKNNESLNYTINPLFKALRNNNTEMFAALLNSGNHYIDLNSTDRASPEGYTLLQEAVLLGHDEIVKLILDASQKNPGMALNLNETRMEGKEQLTSLNIAYNRMIELESQLEAAKSEVEKQKATEEIDKVFASMNLILNHNQGRNDKGEKVDINAALSVELYDDQEQSRRKYNILTDAYQRLMNERVKEHKNEDKIAHLEKFILGVLHHKDVSLDITNEYGQNLLMLAAEQGDSEVVAAVALNKKDIAPNVNKTDHLGNTALIYAAQAGNEGIFRYLLDSGAKKTFNKEETTPLMAACKGGNLAIIDMLSPTFKSLAATDLKGNTPLHYLVSNNNLLNQETEGKFAERNAIVDKFLALDVDINARNAEGKTPLMLAVINGNTAMIRKLIASGADINIADWEGNTPLIYASLLNNPEIITTLLEFKSLNISHKNNNGVSALLIAAAREELESLDEEAKKKLLANFDEKQREEISKLEANSVEKLPQLLIDRGADPYEVDPTNFLWDITKAAGVAAVMSFANHYLFQNIPIAKETGQSLIAAFTAKRFYTTTYEKVRAEIISRLTDDTAWDKRINLTEKLMIGSFHDSGLGLIKHGSSLNSEMNNHKNYLKDKDGNVGGIYTQEELKQQIKSKGIAWQQEAHEMIISKYINVTETLNNKPWYYTFPLFWKTTALNKIAQDILSADKLLLERDKEIGIGSAAKSFEQIFGVGKYSLIDIIKDPKKSKQLMHSLIRSRNSTLQDIDNLIKQVVDNKIIVAPDTFVAFLKFTQKLRELELNHKGREEFISATKPLPMQLLTDLDRAHSFEEITNKFKVKKAFIDTQAEAQTRQVIKMKEMSQSAFEKSMSLVSRITGIKPNQIINKTATCAAHIAGIGAGLFAAMAVDTKVKDLVLKGAVVATAINTPTIMASAVVVAGGFAASAYVLTKGAKVISSWWDTLKANLATKASQEEKEVPPIKNIVDVSGLTVDTKNVVKDLKNIIDIREHNKDLSNKSSSKLPSDLLHEVYGKPAKALTSSANIPSVPNESLKISGKQLELGIEPKQTKKDDKKITAATGA